MIRFTTYTGSIYHYDPAASVIIREHRGSRSQIDHPVGIPERVLGTVYVSEGSLAVFVVSREGKQVFRVTSPVETIEHLA